MPQGKTIRNRPDCHKMMMQLTMVWSGNSGHRRGCAHLIHILRCPLLFSNLCRPLCTCTLFVSSGERYNLNLAFPFSSLAQVNELMVTMSLWPRFSTSASISSLRLLSTESDFCIRFKSTRVEGRIICHWIGRIQHELAPRRISRSKASVAPPKHHVHWLFHPTSSISLSLTKHTTSH